MKVTFSEPVKDPHTTGTFKIDNGTYSAPKVTAGTGANRHEVTLELATALPAGTHKLTVEGVKDFAGFASASKDLTFEVKADTTAPTVSIKEIQSDAKTVVLKFSKDIDENTLNTANVQFSHTYKGSNAVLGNGGSVVTKVSNNEYKVTFANILPPGTTNVYIDYVAGTTDAQKVKDLFGNTLALPVTLTANVVADTVAPTVEKVETTAANKIEVTFSEDVVAADAQTVANYKLTNSKNEVISLNNIAYSSTDKKATITTSANLKAGDYKLEIQNIKDKAVVPNTMVKVVKDLSVADKVAPKVSSVVFDAASKKLIVKFDKDMAQAGLTDLSNYGLKVDNVATAFPAGTVASIKDSKTVEITLGKDVTGLDGATDNLEISGNLTDTLGNKIGGLSTTASITASTTIAPAVVAKSVKFVDTETIVFEVDSELKKIDATVANYIQYDGANIKSFSYVNKGDKAEITVKVADAKKLTDNTASGGITSDLVIAANALESVYGGKNGANITIAAADIADKVAPHIIATGTETADTNGNGQIDQITVKFSEAVLAGSIQESDFSISGGYTVASVVSVNGATVVLKLNESGVADTGATPTITLAGEVSDLQGNKISTSPAVTVADKAKPVVVATQVPKVGTVINANGTYTVTFSEGLAAASQTAVENAVKAAFAKTDGSGNATATPTWDADGKVLTITLTATDATNTITMTAVSDTGLDAVADKATVPNTSTITTAMVQKAS